LNQATPPTQRPEELLYPTDKDFGPTTDFYRDENQQETSTHEQVGRDDRSLNLMVTQAGLAGVPLKQPNNP
jgi:hypothetical protein